MNRILAAALAAVLAVPVSAQVEMPAVEEEDFDYRVEVTASYKTLKGKADFIVSNASQANHVEGGDTAFETKNADGSKSVEFVKWGFIANVLAAASPTRKDYASAQLQVELSGPVDSAGRDRQTWQIQTELRVKEGQTVVVAREGGKVELRLTRVKG